MTAPNRIIPKLSSKDLKRYWLRVEKSATSECWIWKGFITGDGYGGFSLNGKVCRAHRIAYFLHYGEDPGELLVLHNCPNGDNATCVNPDHLFLGTIADNHTDMVKKDRQARGTRHGHHTHPERLARGDRNGSRIHPERLVRGEENSMAKLTSDQVITIRCRYAAGGISYSRLAKEFNISRTNIGDVIRRKTWKHLP